MSSERFLLCRPQGGLNDILSNIDKARLYADKFNRTLIVDTNFVNSDNVLGDFSDYFRSTANIVLNARPLQNKLRDMTVFPACVAKQLESYRAYFDPVRNFVERTTGQIISFRFDLDYSEQLLVHHACGGSNFGMRALSGLQLNEVITVELIRRLNIINGPYIGVHIRNTDYRTDYLRHINSLIPKIAAWDCKNLFVATDNIECVKYCTKLFSSLNVFSFSWLPEIAHPLHYYPDASRRFEITTDAILDLLMLALSKHLSAIPILPTGGFCVQISGVSVHLSGFSLLAHCLRSRPDILHQVVPDVFARVNFLNGFQIGSGNKAAIQQARSDQPVVSRNALCPCGSSKRFKHCCGRLV